MPDRDDAPPDWPVRDGGRFTPLPQGPDLRPAPFPAFEAATVFPGLAP